MKFISVTDVSGRQILINPYTISRTEPMGTVDEPVTAVYSGDTRPAFVPMTQDDFETLVYKTVDEINQVGNDLMAAVSDLIKTPEQDLEDFIGEASERPQGDGPAAPTTGAWVVKSTGRKLYMGWYYQSGGENGASNINYATRFATATEAETALADANSNRADPNYWNAIENVGEGSSTEG